MKRILISIFLLVGVATSDTYAQSKPPGGEDIRSQRHPPALQDDLLDRLVGKWNATGTVHGASSKQTFEADWVLSHQFLRIREKSEENARGVNVPFESLMFIGYDKANVRYVLHSMSMFGAGRPGEFAYGQRIPVAIFNFCAKPSRT